MLDGKIKINNSAKIEGDKCRNIAKNNDREGFACDIALARKKISEIIQVMLEKNKVEMNRLNKYLQLLI